MPLSSVVGAQSIVKPGVCTSSTRPASPYEGQMVYETDTDMIAVWNGSAWRYVASTTATSGTVLQVASTTKTDTFTTTSSTYVDITGLSVSITPKSTSSKILVQYKVMASNATTSEGGYIKLVRDSTDIYVGDAAGSRIRVSSQFWISNTYIAEDVSGTHLDSPASTSSITYKIQTRLASAGTVTINRPGNDADASYTARGTSSITVMEIAG
jgi:hypothetical protein